MAAEELESLIPITGDPDVQVREAGHPVLGAAQRWVEPGTGPADDGPEVPVSGVAAPMANRDLRFGMMHRIEATTLHLFKSVADKVSDATESSWARRLTEGLEGFRAQMPRYTSCWRKERRCDDPKRHWRSGSQYLPSGTSWTDSFVRGWPRSVMGVGRAGWFSSSPSVTRGDSSIAQFLSDPDPLLVLEASRAINDVPITNAMPALAALAEPAKLNPLLQQFLSLRPENLKQN